MHKLFHGNEDVLHMYYCKHINIQLNKNEQIYFGTKITVHVIALFCDAFCTWFT